MRIAVIGAGAVGGYYGAMLARAGNDVTLIARGAHLAAIRERGLTVRASRGEFKVHPGASDSPGEVGPVDLVLLAVKTYDNDTALPMLRPLTATGTAVLTLQNGVDSPAEAAAVIGGSHVLGGAAYIATAIAAPGVIEQTGTHHRSCSERHSMRQRRSPPGPPCYGHSSRTPGSKRKWCPTRACRSGRNASTSPRLPVSPERRGCRLVRSGSTRRPATCSSARVGRSRRWRGRRALPVPPDIPARVRVYADALPPTTRSSLLIDLQAGKRLEVEALQGALVRRARGHGIAAPIMETLYAILRDHSGGQRS